MKMYTKKAILVLGVVLGFGVSMGAKAGLSEVTDQGTTNHPVFPEVKEAWIKEGRYPNLDNLSKIHSGMTRDQIMALIDYPIFSEGFRVREWDYLFHFIVPNAQGGTRIDSCLYKVLFDKNKLAQSFYWKPVSENAVCPLQKDEEKTTAVVESEPMHLNLSADGLFRFNAFSEKDLNQQGRVQLDRFAQALRGNARVTDVSVTAYTDQIGSAVANVRLSQKRADTIRTYLIARGVNSSIIHASGLGEANPVVSCSQTHRSALIACLQPNRRVTIQAK